MTKQEARDVLEKFATERIGTNDWDTVVGIVARAVLTLTAEPSRKTPSPYDLSAARKPRRHR